jgi:hypothetical protein
VERLGVLGKRVPAVGTSSCSSEICFGRFLQHIRTSGSSSRLYPGLPGPPSVNDVYLSGRKGGLIGC